MKADTTLKEHVKMRKYRLFGIINPLDVLLVAGIIALVWGAYIFSAPQQAAAYDGRLIRFTIELFDRPEGFHAGIEPGADVIDGILGINIGRVVYAYGTPFMTDVPDEDANIVRRTAVPGREFTNVVVEAWASVSDYATSIGQFQVRVNMPIHSRSRNFAGPGWVTSLEFQ